MVRSSETELGSDDLQNNYTKTQTPSQTSLGKRRLQFYGHLCRMGEDRLVKKIFNIVNAMSSIWDVTYEVAWMVCTVHSRNIPSNEEGSLHLLVRTVFDTSWRTLAQSLPSTVTADNQCAVGVDIFVRKTVEYCLQPIQKERIGRRGEGSWQIYVDRSSLSIRPRQDKRQRSIVTSLPRRELAGYKVSRDALVRQDKIDVKHLYTEVDFAIGSQFIRHALDDSEPIAYLQGNKSGVPIGFRKTQNYCLNKLSHTHSVAMLSVCPQNCICSGEGTIGNAEFKSIVMVQREFRRVYNKAAPEAKRIRAWHTQFLNTGSVVKRHGGGRRVSGEQEENVHQAQFVGLHLYAYKVQIMQALESEDKPQRYQLACDMLDRCDQNPAFLSHLMFSDEVAFRNSGTARLLSPLHSGASAVCSLAVTPHLEIMEFTGATWTCFLWDYVKDRDTLAIWNLQDLRARFVDTNCTITPDMLARTWTELEYRLNILRVTTGIHVEHRNARTGGKLKIPEQNPLTRAASGTIPSCESPGETPSVICPPLWEVSGSIHCATAVLASNIRRPEKFASSITCTLDSTVVCIDKPMSTVHWLSAVTVEDDNWATVLQEASNAPRVFRGLSWQQAKLDSPLHTRDMIVCLLVAVIKCTGLSITHSHYCFLLKIGSRLNGACLKNCRPITAVGGKNKCWSLSRLRMNSRNTRGSGYKAWPGEIVARRRGQICELPEGGTFDIRAHPKKKKNPTGRRGTRPRRIAFSFPIRLIEWRQNKLARPRRLYLPVCKSRRFVYFRPSFSCAESRRRTLANIQTLTSRIPLAKIQQNSIQGFLGPIPAFAWSDFWRPWKLEIKLARQGFETRVLPSASPKFNTYANSLGRINGFGIPELVNPAHLQLSEGDSGKSPLASRIAHSGRGCYSPSVELHNPHGRMRHVHGCYSHSVALHNPHGRTRHVRGCYSDSVALHNPHGRTQHVRGCYSPSVALHNPHGRTRQVCGEFLVNTRTRQVSTVRSSFVGE
ncbi:hypothetical protein PR048_029664 [Dryococelus australis]|uniref:Uncharacterized protein n=1 Tax=Dryococelus australis TaxID=614101 RepID=A0ABQ9GFY8_9NEOP|nr:hypothetical protein PR048_029664 [Dryococelus australis]